MKLTKSQKKAEKAFKEFLDNTDTCICLSGKPGTGKTWFIKQVLIPMCKRHVCLTATTNKAALLLRGCTIHGALSVKVKQTNDESQYTLDTSKVKAIHDSIVIIDEASMLDKQMLDIILNNCVKCKIIFVGDLNQLPAVKCPADVFKLYPVIELTDVVRQKKKDLIEVIESAKEDISLVQLTLPEESTANVHIIRDENELNSILKTFTKDDRLLSYTNAECVKYNKLFRELNNLPKCFQVGDCAISKSYCESAGNSNKSSFFAMEESIIDFISEPHKVEFEGKQYDFMVRDVRVKGKMATFIMPENFEVYKKTLNRIYSRAAEVSRTDKNAARIYWRMYYFFKENMVDLRDVTACTVHESQGSTYNRVIVNFDDIVHGNGITINTKTRMLYVALSRAKEEIFIYTKRH